MVSARQQLSHADQGGSSLQCRLGEESPPNAPSILPRRAVSSFCQDEARHSADRAPPSRASAVRFPFQPPMFSPPYFLFLRWSHYDYASELIFVFSDRDSIRACCGWL